MRRAFAVAVLLCAVTASADCPRSFNGGDSFGRGPAMYFGDFNEDGRVDYAAWDIYGHSPATMMLNRGNEVFESAGPAPAGSDVEGNVPVTVRDFNGDGHLDVLFETYGRIIFYAGAGDGTFAAPRTVTLDSSREIVADLDKDGHPEVIALKADHTAMVIYAMGPNAELTQRASLPLNVPGMSPTLLAADFDGDGRVDVAYAENGDPYNLTQLFLFYQQPDGSFAPVATASLPLAGTALTADLDGDGASEIFIPQHDFIQAASLRGRKWTAEKIAVPGIAPSVVALMDDFDHDGYPDLIFSGNVAGIAWGSAHGLTAASDFAIRGNKIAVVDIDGDGLEDLAGTARGQLFADLSVIHGRNGRRDLDGVPTVTVGFSIGTAALGDFDGDGNLDVLAGSRFDQPQFAVPPSSSVVLAFGDGHGGFVRGPSTSFFVDTHTYNLQVLAGDFDGDGHLDAALLGNSSKILFGDGTRTFGTASLSLPVHDAYTVVRPDPNGPSMLVSWQDGNFVALSATHDRTLDIEPIAQENQYRTVQKAPDGGLILSGYSLPQEWFVRMSDGTWQKKSGTVPPPAQTLTDLNGDGRLDVVDADFPYLEVWLANADGTYTASWSNGGLDEAPAIAVADVDGDGKPDILASGTDATHAINALWFRNDGASRFTQSFPIQAGNTVTRALAAADFNGDGLGDLLLVAEDGIRTLYTGCEPSPYRVAVVPAHPAEGQAAKLVVNTRVDGMRVTVSDNAQPRASNVTSDFTGNVIVNIASMTKGHHVFTVVDRDPNGTSPAATLEIDVAATPARRRAAH